MNRLLKLIVLFLIMNSAVMAQQTYEVTDRVIHKEAIVEADLKAVWERWTTHEGLLQFFGAGNQIELIPGGNFEIYFSMDAEPGTRGAEGCKVLSYSPLEMLSFSWNAPPTIPEVRNHEHKAWVVVRFESIDGERVRVDLKHLGFLSGPEWDKTYDYFMNAWSYVMNNLKKSFEEE